MLRPPRPWRARWRRASRTPHHAWRATRARGTDAFIARRLGAAGDAGRVIGGKGAPHFGTLLTDDSLASGAGAWIGPTTFSDWLGAEGAAARTGARSWTNAARA
jgi:hypothetical protein